MRPTRRGWATIVAAAVAVLVAWVFGSRALNVVAVAAVIGFAVGAVQLHAAETPSIDRSTFAPGFPGETRTVSIDVSGTRGTIVHVTDALSDGLTATGNVFEGTLPVGTSYEVTLAERGRQTVGPTTIRQHDGLGLLRRTERLDERTSILVYPTVHDIAGSETLAAVVERTRTPERGEIDRLREYTPGDPLRDIAWKASAKRFPNLVVAEFAGQETSGTIELAVVTTPDRIDDAAGAAASVGLFLLGTGIDIGISVPDGRLEPGSGRAHRHNVLRLLAETQPGTVEERTWAEADIRIAGEDGVTVDTGARTVAFERVRAGDARKYSVDSDRADRTEGFAP